MDKERETYEGLQVVCVGEKKLRGNMAGLSMGDDDVVDMREWTDQRGFDAYAMKLLVDLRPYAADIVSAWVRKPRVYGQRNIIMGRCQMMAAIYVDATVDNFTVLYEGKLEHNVMAVTTPGVPSDPPTLKAMCAASLVRTSPQCDKSSDCPCWRCMRAPRVLFQMMNAASDAYTAIASSSGRIHPSILHHVCIEQDVVAVRELLIMGADPNKDSRSHSTPMQCVLWYQMGAPKIQAEIMRMLIGAGGDVTKGTLCGESSIHRAISYHNGPCVAAMVENGGVGWPGGGGAVSALFEYAVQERKTDMALVILEANNDVVGVDKWLYYKLAPLRRLAGGARAAFVRWEHGG